MSYAQLDPETRLRRLAERRVDARRGFLAHATVYVVVIGALAVLNLTTSPHSLWVVWPAGGWGIGLAFHAWAVFGAFPGDREAAVQREMDRLRAGRGA